jgi:hypothetical protein
MSRLMRIITGCLVAVAFSTVAVTLTADGGTRTVQLRDDCDPATFNADPPVGPGAGHICDGDGDTTFGEFIAEAGATHAVDHWRFNPASTNDTRLVAENRGGETHTFTPVAKFGDGSVVPGLNQVLGNPALAPECADGAKFGASVVPSGATSKTIAAKPGDHFQCCIHPWMRVTVTK